MKKTFYLVVLLFVSITSVLNAQNTNQFKADQQPISRTLIKDLHSFLNGAVSTEFQGAVIFNDRLLAKGLKSVSSFPVDTIQTITYISPEKVTQSLINSDSQCQYGILILNTSSAAPMIKKESAMLSNLEQIILNYRKVLYKNESGEPD